MAEPQPKTTQAQTPEVKKERWYKRLTTKHPRLVRVVGITAGVAAVAGAVAVVRNAKTNGSDDQTGNLEVESNASSTETPEVTVA